MLCWFPLISSTNSWMDFHECVPAGKTTCHILTVSPTLCTLDTRAHVWIQYHSSWHNGQSHYVGIRKASGDLFLGLFDPACSTDVFCFNPIPSAHTYSYSLKPLIIMMLVVWGQCLSVALPMENAAAGSVPQILAEFQIMLSIASEADDSICHHELHLPSVFTQWGTSPCNALSHFLCGHQHRSLLVAGSAVVLSSECMLCLSWLYQPSSGAPNWFPPLSHLPAFGWHAW